ncbi:uncharacterized protein [Mobula birostris]|uniref:uncharacterized protein isoform X5 n=1 Tax=Mobula birostris TaxID=1983395 RepID=UPI003B2898B3
MKTFGQMASGVSSALLGLLILLTARWRLGYAMLVGAPWWTGVISTVAGMLITAVRRSPNKSTTIACLVANVICALACPPRRHPVLAERPGLPLHRVLLHRVPDEVCERGDGDFAGELPGLPGDVRPHGHRQLQEPRVLRRAASGENGGDPR